MSGITRFRSKSMVLPKPWQRGQAPKGLLKLNRRGSGSRPGRWQLLHSNAAEKRWRGAVRLLVARQLLKDDFAGLAIGDLRGIDDARAVLAADNDSVQQYKDGQREIQIEQRLGRGEFEDAALLIEAIEAARRAARSGAL